MNKGVINFLKSKNVNVIDEDIQNKLDVWEQWYKGKVDKFHDYKVYQGKKKLKQERKTLNMALRVCQRWADLILNEKVEINIEDEYTNEVAQKLLKQVNFYVKGNNLVERSFALGKGFFIQYWDGEKTNQKYISQEYFYPISFENGKLTECGFSSEKVIDNKKYIYLETHTLNDKKEYVIDNFLLLMQDKELVEVDSKFYLDHKIEQKIETGRTEPLFQPIGPNVANRDNFDSAFGTSVFSGAVDIFKTTDVIYDGYYKEFLLGKKRIFVPDGVSNLNYIQNSLTGETESVQVFDPNDEVFYRLPEFEDGSQPIIESNMDLRVDAYDKGLQTQLNLISQQCGFGDSGFTWEKGNVSTATQIISENSEMYRTLKKHELLFKPSIIDMVKGLLYIESTFKKDKKIKLDVDVTVDFDDSIIEDKAEIKRQALLELNVGLIDPIQYYIDVYKMTLEQAIKYRQELLDRAEPQPEEEPPMGA